MNSRSPILVLAMVVFVLAGSTLYSQRAPSRLIIENIDENKRVTLHGTVRHWVKQPTDRGATPDALAATRVLLLLDRPASRKLALQAFLRDVHNRDSAIYHRWITPEQFGKQFGPNEEDIQAAVNWLQSHGLVVGNIPQGKQFIEFSGTAGQLRTALHTEIHEYDIAGETHYANANEISVPAALAPLIRGISPLHDFIAKPYLKVGGEALYSQAGKKTLPLWTVSNPFGSSSVNGFALAPEDFATQYDLTPLYQAGLDGTGQTIGIINESNIDVSLVNAYRRLFGLSDNPTHVVIDGDDPGTVNGIDTEAYLDVELAGAVAPNATVNLYVAKSGSLQDPLALAAIRAVEDNEASVLSVSFGQCESILGNAGNQLWATLWEQASAQGQTVFVASGDSGPYCNNAFFNEVSGIASTPWDVAVGGTDFFYSDYASGGASASTAWNTANDASLGSLKAPLPEQVWNDGFGLNILDGLPRHEIGAAGSGASSCSTLSSSNVCSGYAKPNWQTGTGVPADGVRDIPDVSLFASNGANLSAYSICAFAGECVPDSNGVVNTVLIGGTSASSPAMAGIMTLVDQKYGRQGLANLTLYQLAGQQPAAFHDITLGSNQSPCQSGSQDCAANANGSFETTIYSAGTGFDLATGLGSVDANVLVKQWNSVNLLPSATTLTLSAKQVKHGTPVTVNAAVAAKSGSAIPAGDVAISTTAPVPESQGQTFLTLSGGKASSSINFFPGGTYNLSATYSGDGVFGRSTSSPVTLDVTPEGSNINFSVLNKRSAVSNGDSVQYNDPVILEIRPNGVSAANGKTDGLATGSATFTMDSTTATVALNGVGVASWTPPALQPGSHSASATYSGDASFDASSATAVTFSVTPGTPSINDNINAPAAAGIPGFNVDVGGSVTIGITVGPTTRGILGTAAPTGSVTACLGSPGSVSVVCANPTFTQVGTLTRGTGVNAQISSTVVTFSNLTAGTYTPSFSYSGDANWKAFGLTDLRFVNVISPSLLTPSKTVLNITPSSVSGSELTTLSTTVSGTGNVPPTGEVDFYDNGIFLAFVLLPTGKAGATNSASFLAGPSFFWSSGTNQITAIYDGDGNYAPSTSNTASLAATQSGDFSVAPQIPQITIKAGSSGQLGLNLASLNGFNGDVAFSCVPSSSKITCGINPSTVALNASATASLTVTASAAASANTAQSFGAWIGLVGAGSTFMFASMVLLGTLGEPKRRASVMCVIAMLALFASGCGGGSSRTNPQPSPQPSPTPINAAIYSVVVSATANGVIHNATVRVAVQ